MAITWFAKTIYQSQSGVRVFQNPWYRWLTFGNEPIQSLIARKDPGRPVQSYVPAMSLPVLSDPGSVCLLGLGGASLLHYLEARSIFNLQAVEISPEVIAIARDYFYLNRLTNLSIHETAAEIYLQNPGQHYKHLLVDVHTAETLPPACATPEFIQSCKAALSEDGYLSLNLLHPTDQLRMTKIVQNEFNQQTLIIPIPGYLNLILIAAKSGIDPLIAKFEQMGHIKKLYWDPQWGRMMLAKK